MKFRIEITYSNGIGHNEHTITTHHTLTDDNHIAWEEPALLSAINSAVNKDRAIIKPDVRITNIYAQDVTRNS